MRTRGADIAPLSIRSHNHILSNLWEIVTLSVAVGGRARAVDGPLPGPNQVGPEDIFN